MVPAENFIELRLKELGVHEWDVRAGLEPAPHLSDDLRIDRLGVAALGVLVGPDAGQGGALSLCRRGPRTDEARSRHRRDGCPHGGAQHGLP